MNLPSGYEHIIMHTELENILTALTETQDDMCIIGPAGCLTGNTKIKLSRAYNDFQLPLDVLHKRFHDTSWDKAVLTYVRSYDEQEKQVKLNKVVDVLYSGVKTVYELKLVSGDIVQGTYDHKIMTSSGWKALGTLAPIDYVLTEVTINRGLDVRSVVRQMRVESVKKLHKKEMTYDIVCEAPHHSFVANNIIVHNSGKTSFLKMATDKRIYNKETIVCTPTAISAVNASSDGVRATTIHSLFRLPPLSVIPPERLVVHNHLVDLFENLDTLIIDEISMVNSDLLTKIQYLLQEYTANKIRFIIIGDPSQLAPIVSSKAERDFVDDLYGTKFFFGSPVFKGMSTFTLSRIFRQQDQAFADVLNKFRLDTVTQEDRAIINARVQGAQDFKKSGDFIYVGLTNRKIDAINTREVNRNTHPERQYNGKVTNTFKENELPTPIDLRLKEGVQVIVSANNHTKGYYNGMMGHVVSLHDDYIRIVDRAGVLYDIEPFTWHKYAFKYDKTEKSIDADVTGKYTQFPLKIAYAMTAHKTQGLTLDRVYLDLERGTFASGQLYTSLSRCRTLEGLGLARPITKRDNRLSRDVKNFYKKYGGTHGYTQKQEIYGVSSDRPF